MDMHSAKDIVTRFAAVLTSTMRLLVLVWSMSNVCSLSVYTLSRRNTIPFQLE